MIVLKSLLYIFIAANLNFQTQSAGWHGIIPFHSTRADVERLIGPPSPLSKSVYGKSNSKAIYETKDAVVIIDYTENGCERGKPSGWNVPLGTVGAITVNPRSRIKLSDLKLDMTKYKVVQDEEVRSAVYYVNEEDGIHIESRNNLDIVVSTIYLPTSADLQRFRCPK